MSFFIKNSFNLENLGDNFSFIASLKKKPASKTGKTVKELREYLELIKDKSKENEFEGFVLVDGMKKNE